MQFCTKLAFLLLNCVLCSAEWTQERDETLDDNGNFKVHWSIDYENKLVRFDVVVRTKGFVGFGISTNGGMTGSDIVIGGVHPNMSAYFDDRHGTGFITPVVDVEQNWVMLSAAENSTHTSLQFQRLFDTCDDQDLAITNDTTNFIWSYGETDDISYHGSTNRGSVSVNILDPVQPPLDLTKFMSFEITQNITMPSQDTTYWCSVLKSPTFDGKRHFVAFDVSLPTVEAKKYTHHYSVYKCIAPEGIDEDTFFGPYVGLPGAECYNDPPMVPVRECKSMLYVWAIGGRVFALPDNVGYPVGETTSHEYYMLEVHYDNPDEVEGVQFQTGAIIYYTDEIREHDAGLMLVGHDSNLAITMPPEVDSFKTVGHCDAGCTSAMLPQDGVNVFAVFLHSHLAGRGHKLRHFREGEELPWPAIDLNYNFEYQQTRLLREPLKIQPGDHLSAECLYSTSDRKGVTIGGLSSREEMCEHFMWYWPKSPLTYCLSSFPWGDMLQMFGIESITLPYYNPIVTAPEHMANMSYTDVLNNIVQWTPELKTRLQDALLNWRQDAFCVPAIGEQILLNTTYPQTAEYQPPKTC